MTRTLAIMGIMCFATLLSAQDTGNKTEHTLSFKSQYVQIKDEFNYGLVNRGLNLVGEYTLVSHMDNNIFSYQADLGFGVNYNRGVGMMWSLKPFDFFYGFRLNNNPDMPVTLGPYLSDYYKWFLYPELQSGHMFWLSSYEVGPRFQISLPLKNRRLQYCPVNITCQPEFKTRSTDRAILLFTDPFGFCQQSPFQHELRIGESV